VGSIGGNDYNNILNGTFSEAEKEVKIDGGKKYFNNLNSAQKDWLIKIVQKAESLKAVVTVLTTSLVKKIENPRQDIRYHKHEMENGYSGRTLDTTYITPFFKKHFHRLAMKESGWLTRSIEQPHPFTKDFPGKIRDREVKAAFIDIIDDIETKKTDPKIYLVSLFILLIKFMSIKHDQINISKIEKGITISSIIDALKIHFFERYSVSGASRLPVLAIYSIYQILVKDVSRFENKKLLPLRSHISPDARAKGIGDLEVTDEYGNYFEAVEIKHGISIDSIMIEDAFDKFKTAPIKRYYLLTTAEPNIKKGEESEVLDVIKNIRKDHGCEVIVNGLIHSLKYYLRLLNEPSKFIENYTRNLEIEFSKTTEIKREHIEKWKRLLILFE
jgi:DNA (cytosine-5)-methyltransferase 1